MGNCCSTTGDAAISTVDIQLQPTASAEPITPPKLSAAVEKVMFNLGGFNASKTKVLETAEAHMPKRFMARFDSFKREDLMRQRMRDGKHAASYEDLLSVAKEAKPVFETAMRTIVQDASLDPDAYAMYNDKRLPLDEKNDIYFQALTLAPPKGEERCKEKATNDYGGDFSYIVDVVRCSIVVQVRMRNAAAPPKATAPPARLSPRLSARGRRMRIS